MSQNSRGIDLVIGLGEIGLPLRDILARVYPTVGRDIEPMIVDGDINVLHICYPYQIADFAGSTTKYIDEYQPNLTVIHSTVVPGTTRRIAGESTKASVAYSPVRGKHSRMKEDLLKFSKFVAGVDPTSAQEASNHLKRAGFKVKLTSDCEALEMGKLVETTYFGLLVAWAQEVERSCKLLGVEYDEVLACSEEVEYLPSVIFRPGYIGGHCIIPNTYLLEEVRNSPFLDLIRNSNEKKRDEWIREGRDLAERLSPRPVPNIDERTHELSS